MDLNARKDHFSRAVVRAVSAAAGIVATVPEHDQDSVDMTFAAPDSKDGPGPRLDAQLKCSENLAPSGEAFSFDLKVKNYNDLRHPAGSRYVPRILVVVHVPPDPADWFKCDPEQIVMRRCAYWVSLAGAPSTTNTATVAVQIPTAQVFNPESLLGHLRRPGEGL